MSEEFWLLDPLVLFTNFCDFNILSNKDLSTNLNAYTRFIIITSIICYCLTRNYYYFIGGLILIILLIVLYFIMKNKEKFEFEYIDINNDSLKSKYGEKIVNEKLDYEKLPKKEPEKYNSSISNNNVLMNNQITDYDTEQITLEAEKTGQKLNDYIKNGLAQQQSQYVFDVGVRQYHTMPNSSVPNDTIKFANWLYGQDKVCKEGSIYMHHTGTPPEQEFCNGFNTSVPTNMGNLND